MNNINLAPALVTHHDLDGVFCAVLGKACFNNLKTIITDYKDVDAIVEALMNDPEVGEIYITDLSVKPETAQKLEEAQYRVRLLDHHATAKPLTKYPWATVDTTECGTSLFYRHLMLAGHANLRPYKDTVRRVKDHDLWNHRYPESQMLSTLLGIVGPERFTARFLEQPSYKLSNGEQFLLELEEERKTKYIRETQYTMHQNKDGWSFAMCIADRYMSELGHAIIEEADVEYVIMIDPRKQVVSLRGKGNVHLGNLAKECGGGGHAKAAGFPLTGGSKAIIKNMLEV